MLLFDAIRKYGWLGISNNRPNSHNYYVDKKHAQALDADDGVHGQCWETPFATIAYAIAANNAAHDLDNNPQRTMFIASSTYTVNLTAFPKNCTVYGTGGKVRIQGYHSTGAAQNSRWHNIQFRSSTASQPIITVASASHGIEFHECVFDSQAAISHCLLFPLNSSISDIVIENCRIGYDSTPANSPDIAIEFAGVHAQRGKILNNQIYSTGIGIQINATMISNNFLLIKDNVIANRCASDAQMAVGISDLTPNENGGLYINNFISATDAFYFGTVAGDKSKNICINNYVVQAGVAGTTVLDAINLDHLALTTTGVAADGELDTHITPGSILGHIMATDADPSNYNASSDSLQAIGADVDAILADTGTTLPATLAENLQIYMGYELKSIPGSAMPIAIWFVDGNIGASGDGTTPATAFQTIAEAITASSNSVDDWILVFDYSGGGGTITIDKSFVHIIGNANPAMPYPRIKPASAVPGITFAAAGNRVEIANMVIGGGDQTVPAISFPVEGAYGVWIHDCVIGRDADAPCLEGIYVAYGGAAPYIVIENNRFYGSDGAGIAAAGSAIRIAGNATRCRISGNYIQDVGRTATPAIWLDGSVANPQIENNRIKTDTDTGTGSGITLGASVDDGWIAGNLASDGKDAPAQNPFVDAGDTNGWSQNYSGIVAVLPA